MNPLLRRLRFRRFSRVQLLIALGLLFTCVPVVEEIKGGELIAPILFSLVLLARVLAVADRIPGRTWFHLQSSSLPGSS